MVQPIDQGAILQSGMLVGPDYAGDMLAQQEMQIRGQQANALQQQAAMKQADAMREEQENAQFEADYQAYLKNPDPQILVNLMARYPKRSEGLKRAFEGQDQIKRTSDIRSAAEMYSFVGAGRYDLAAKRLEARIAQERAAGQEPDEADIEMLEALKSDDPDLQQAAKGMIGMALAVANPDKFADTYGKLNPAENKTTLEREYEFVLRTQGQAAADRLVSNRSDPNITTTLPGNRFYSGPQSGLAGALGGGIVDTRPEEQRGPYMSAEESRAESLSAMLEITAKSESGNRDFNRDGSMVTSPKGARGRMQVMPGTERDPGFGVRPAQNDTPEELSRVGRDYFAAMLRRYGNDPAKAWAAYNAGPGRLDEAMRGGGDWLKSMPAETRQYVTKNMAALRKGGASDQPVRVASIQQARALPPGTIFITPDGRTKRR